ncbi:uncharacterized protein EV420DRAFT_1752727 [Desarmillaria tabescens]|uniref:DUF6534 domain-containing protein n=1 Tax=Armillaria tabescens TaxID=1929756 RepID=A0AA39JCU6_ARMTA|nr:uncharacterized protein EV420DRAFT_1752727 [Desarmillaria tabescens]KAK0440425.1 hypothetical protein EV420DRAFT_1752727 [Desarmillaria tabescens]
MSAVPASRPTSLPALDNTLGALYIGASLAMLLYGAICVQTFLYITSNRARSDRWWLKLLVLVIVVRTSSNAGLDTVQQGVIMAGMYRFLVSDFANPAALEEGGADSGVALTTYESSIIGVCSVLLMQLFFCWRIWKIGASSLNLWMRITFMAITVPLAFFNFASYIAMGVLGSQHRLQTSNSPGFSLAVKLAASSGMAFDVIVTLAMITSLHRVRSGIIRSDHVITLLTLFTVNTNLITTLLSVGSLVTFLVLPDATVYGGISFLIAKSYLNSFLAILNSRDYLREKLDPSMSIHEAQSSHPVFAEFNSTDTTTTQQMEESEPESALVNDSSTKV